MKITKFVDINSIPLFDILVVLNYILMPTCSGVKEREGEREGERERH